MFLPGGGETDPVGGFPAYHEEHAGVKRKYGRDR